MIPLNSRPFVGKSAFTHKGGIHVSAVKAVSLAASFTDNVDFSAEDGSRSDPVFLCKIFEAVIDAGATTVNLPDTVGYAVPEKFEKLVSYVMENTPNMDKAVLSVHCHNDLGLATARTAVRRPTTRKASSSARKPGRWEISSML
jgi:isopropylmalate/homocitrate/citramalate synthase